MARYEVRISATVDAWIAEEFGPERTAGGRPSLHDFETGALAAARLRFARFDELTIATGPAVRTLTVVDPFIGAVVFTAVLIAPLVVEIADVSIDDEYWIHLEEFEQPKR